MWWRHQMEIFSALLALCVGNSPVTGEFPIERPVTRSFGVFFDLRVNNRGAGDLRRHRAHYDVIIIYAINQCEISWWFRNKLQYMFGLSRRVTSQVPDNLSSSLWHDLIYYMDLNLYYIYHQISNIRHTKLKKLKCFSSRLAVVFVQYIETRC